MSFNRPSGNASKYKLVKCSTDHRLVTNKPAPLRTQFNLVNNNSNTNNVTIHKSSSGNSFFKHPAPPVAATSSSFKLDNSTNTILTKTLESSNRLDVLLERCRSIGNASSGATKASTSISKSVSISIPTPVPAKPEASQQLLRQTTSKYKLTNTSANNLKPSTSSSAFRLNNVNTSSARPRIPQIPSPSKFKLTRYAISNKRALLTKINNKKRESITKLDINVLLGRTISNLSRNKFKFINRNAKVAPSTAMKPHRLINGCFSSQKILNIKGISFKLNKNGNKLSRLTASPFSVRKSSSSSSAASVPLMGKNGAVKASLLLNKMANTYKVINTKLVHTALNNPQMYRLVLARYTPMKLHQKVR